MSTCIHPERETGVTTEVQELTKEDVLFLSALQNESYRNAILSLLYGQEES